MSTSQSDIDPARISAAAATVVGIPPLTPIPNEIKKTEKIKENVLAEKSLAIEEEKKWKTKTKIEGYLRANNIEDAVQPYVIQAGMTLKPRSKTVTLTKTNTATLAIMLDSQFAKYSLDNIKEYPNFYRFYRNGAPTFSVGIAVINKEYYLVTPQDLIRGVIRKSRRLHKTIKLVNKYDEIATGTAWKKDPPCLKENVEESRNDKDSDQNNSTDSSSETRRETHRDEVPNLITVASNVKNIVDNGGTSSFSTTTFETNVDVAYQEQATALLRYLAEKEGLEFEG